MKLVVQCWQCGFKNNRVAAFDNMTEMPKNGDLSFCGQCGHFAVFDFSLEDKARKPSPREKDEIESHIELMRIQSAWVRSKKYRK